MKVACLQYSPQLGQFEANVHRAEQILESAIPSLSYTDWLVLPELAFTGYNFPSLDSIRPFLEPTASGPSTQWASNTARRLQCHVTVGYPEKTANPNEHYNSVVTVAPDGTVLGNYRKRFLYYTDEVWALEGDQPHFYGELGALGPVSVGICMDINPYKFLAPWKEYEFATRALQMKSPMVVLSMAWLTRLEPQDLAQFPAEPDTETLAYWLERFAPIIDAARPEPVALVMANRCGIEEGGANYAGTSAVICIQDGMVSIWDILGRAEEKCLVVDLSQPPKYALQAQRA